MLEFTSRVEHQAADLVILQEQEVASNAEFIGQLDTWEAEEDGCVFMEFCA